MLTLSGSYSKKLQHTFLKLTSNSNEILRQLLVKITTQCSRVYIKQYWYFQCSKLNHGKNFFPEFISQNTNNLKKLLSRNINLFRVRISNSIYTLTELLPNNSEHFFESFNEYFSINTDRIYSNWKFPGKIEKVSIHTWNI